MLTGTPCNRIMAYVYNQETFTRESIILITRNCDDFVNWSTITKIASWWSFIQDKPTVKPKVMCSNFQSSIGKDCKNFFDLWCSTLACWHVKHTETKYQFSTFMRLLYLLCCRDVQRICWGELHSKFLLKTLSFLVYQLFWKHKMPPIRMSILHMSITEERRGSIKWSSWICDINNSYTFKLFIHNLFPCIRNQLSTRPLVLKFSFSNIKCASRLANLRLKVSVTTSILRGWYQFSSRSLSYI